MSTYSRSVSSYRLIASQGLNALGDHGAKITASALVAAIFPEQQAAVWVGLISALYVVPYLVLAPLAGRVTARFSKLQVVKGSLLLQVAGMGVIGLSSCLQSFAGVMIGLTLVACQSSFLAPSRNALLKDLCGSERIGQMMGLLGLAGVGATLAGLALGGWSFDRVWLILGTPWMAAGVAGFVSCVIAILAYVAVSGINASMEAKSEVRQSFIAVGKELLSRPVLRWSSLGLAWFYGVGAMMVMILLQAGRLEHGQEAGAASMGGAMAALLGLGVAIGSGIAAYLGRKRIEVGLSFLGAILLAVLIPATALMWSAGAWAAAGIFSIGLAGGLFSAPLNALFVASARDEARVATIAANNLVINLVSGVFVLIATAMAYWGMSPQAQIWLVAATSLVVVGFMTYLIPESLVRVLLLAVARVLYPLRLKGISRMPKEGGVLLVANHVSYADALLLAAASPRPIRFMGTDEMLRYPLMKWVYRKFNVIAVSPERSRQAISKTVEALKEGSVVCVFPEGALTRTGMTMPFKKGVELMARLSGAPVLPAYIDGMWGSVFSFSDKPFRYRVGMPLRRRIGISFGEAIAADVATTVAMRDAVLELGCETFSNRRDFNKSIAEKSLAALRKKPFAGRLADRGPSGKRFSNLGLLVTGQAFARYFRTSVSTSRVGIILPPGIAGFAANLGAVWSGKSAVNLNPTVSSASLTSMIESAGLDRIVTSKAVLDRFPQLGSSGAKLIFVEDLRSVLGGTGSVLRALAGLLLPLRWAMRLHSIPPDGGDREAMLLFSSGSSAQPKGIPISHRNMLANTTQLSECFLMHASDCVLANLPLFHSFGLTGGFWLPLLNGMKIVSTPSALQVKENVAAVKEEKVTVMLGTPTFLRGYLKRATDADFASLRLVVTGAEKLPAAFAEAWQNRFGIPLLEGYGMTECTPVISANCLQSRELQGRYASRQQGSKGGTAGRPLPGILVRIGDELNPGKARAAGESGLILVKGPNVFSGYLEPKSENRFTADGWLDTGDLGYLDQDGCLVIEGRRTRFSKIGGEMVSHVCVESAVADAYSETGEDLAGTIFVGSKTCERKGEALVLLTTVEIEQADLTRKLRESGLPNLWIPQNVVKVSALPMLGSGKLDLKRCVEICGMDSEAVGVSMAEAC